MIIRSRSPLRISFAGGGTDVPPYPQERGGAVLSITIDKHTYVSLEPNDEDAITVQSLDYDIVAKYHTEQDLAYNGELDLVKAVIRRMAADRRGMKLFMHSDAPPGSGLGSSSALVVSIVGALRHWLRQPLTDYETAELAHHIERDDLNIKGGLQDHYASTFGGVNFIEFYDKAVIVNPLRVRPERLDELEYNLVLCYTGQTRLSANILERQIASFVQKKAIWSGRSPLSCRRRPKSCRLWTRRRRWPS